MLKAKKKLIKFRPELFWDVNPKNIDPKKHAQYIIERVLDFGDLDEMRWLAGYYPKKFIKDTMRDSRVVGDKSKNLWSLVF
jgi:hypothetical protein